jgi:hypothetical protein
MPFVIQAWGNLIALTLDCMLVSIMNDVGRALISILSIQVWKAVSELAFTLGTTFAYLKSRAR